MVILVLLSLSLFSIEASAQSSPASYRIVGDTLEGTGTGTFVGDVLSLDGSLSGDNCAYDATLVVDFAVNTATASLFNGVPQPGSPPVCGDLGENDIPVSGDPARFSLSTATGEFQISEIAKNVPAVPVICLVMLSLLIIAVAADQLRLKRAI